MILFWIRHHEFTFLMVWIDVFLMIRWIILEFIILTSDSLQQNVNRSNVKQRWIHLTFIIHQNMTKIYSSFYLFLFWLVFSTSYNFLTNLEFWDGSSKFFKKLFFCEWLTLKRFSISCVFFVFFSSFFFYQNHSLKNFTFYINTGIGKL